MDYRSEIQTKLERVRALMDARGVKTLWLRRVDNVAWLTGGVDTAVNTADVIGVASLVVTATGLSMHTNTIEEHRLRDEDKVEERGIPLHVVPWEGPAFAPPSDGLGADTAVPGAVDLSADLARLRVRLLPVEQERYRALGGMCAEAMQRAINRVKPGISEAEIAAALSYETRAFNVNPVVVLIGVDDRIYNFRHPVVTKRIMERYAMLVLCGRREGLVCSVTRLIHFGALPDDLRRKQAATAEVDAAMLAASQPGATLEDVFRAAQQAYARTGYADEWKLHHQGGLAGYNPREGLGVPGAAIVLEQGMACAWNPSITGTKCEDTILVPAAGQPPEILTPMYGWPVQRVEVGGMTLERPLIMEVVD